MRPARHGARRAGAKGAPRRADHVAAAEARLAAREADAARRCAAARRGGLRVASRSLLRLQGPPQMPLDVERRGPALSGRCSGDV